MPAEDVQGAIADLRRFAAPGYVALLVCSALALLGGGAAHELGSPAQPSPPPAARAATPVGSFTSVPLPARATISSALGSVDPAYRIRGRAGILTAVNASQRLNARFDRTGAMIRAGQSLLRLQLAGVAPISPDARRNSVSYAYPGVDESFTNGPLGLEQSFVISRASGDRLTLPLALSGNLRASLAGDHQSAVFSARRPHSSRLPRSVRERRTRPPSTVLAGARSKPAVDPSRHDGVRRIRYTSTRTRSLRRRRARRVPKPGTRSRSPAATSSPAPPTRPSAATPTPARCSCSRRRTAGPGACRRRC